MKYKPEDWPVGTCVLYSFGWIRLAEGVIVAWAFDGEHVKIKDGKRTRWFEADQITFNSALSAARRATGGA